MVEKLTLHSLATALVCKDRGRGREAGTGSEHLMNNGHETAQDQNTDSVWTGETETTTMLTQGTHWEADRDREGNQQIKGVQVSPMMCCCI
jgi:hypothetical protein